MLEEDVRTASFLANALLQEMIRTMTNEAIQDMSESNPEFGAASSSIRNYIENPPVNMKDIMHRHAVQIIDLTTTIVGNMMSIAQDPEAKYNRIYYDMFKEFLSVCSNAVLARIAEPQVHVRQLHPDN